MQVPFKKCCLLAKWDLCGKAHSRDIWQHMNRKNFHPLFEINEPTTRFYSLKNNMKCPLYRNFFFCMRVIVEVVHCFGFCSAAIISQRNSFNVSANVFV